MAGAAGHWLLLRSFSAEARVSTPACQEGQRSNLPPLRSPSVSSPHPDIATSFSFGVKIKLNEQSLGDLVQHLSNALRFCLIYQVMAESERTFIHTQKSVWSLDSMCGDQKHSLMRCLDSWILLVDRSFLLIFNFHRVRGIYPKRYNPSEI